MPTVSIIVPVYNTGEYLLRCVQSILAQTFQDFECILVDDGSEKTTAELCDEYELLDSRIRVIHQENQGPSVARNIGVLASKGEYIFFIDSDDCLPPYSLESLYAPIAAGVADFSMGNFVRFSEREELKRVQTSLPFPFSVHTFSEDFLLLLYQDLFKNGNTSCFTSWGKLIKRQIVVRYPFAEGRIYEDAPVVLHWCKDSGRLSVVGGAVYEYFTNLNGITKREFTLKRLDSLWAWDLRMQFYKENGFTKCEAMMFPEYASAYLNCLYQVYYVLRNKKVYRQYRKKALRIVRKSGAVKSKEEKLWRLQVLHPIRFLWFIRMHRIKCRVLGK